MLTADVLVVGAGPAGASAAIWLARAGRSVVVVDKAAFPRDKCCGDGLTTLALRELEAIGLAPHMVPNWKSVDEAWLRSPSGREVEVPLPGVGTFAATTPRVELDAALVHLAGASGASVHDGHALVAVRQFDDRIEADVHGLGAVTARYIVAADGMWSPTRKLLGAGEAGYLGEWHAFRQYARGVTGPAAHRLYVWFEDDLLPGYAWSFPLPGGRANVGFGVLRNGVHSGGDMKHLWTDLWQRPHIATALGPGFEFEDRHTAWPIPAGIDRATLTVGRTLFVGDAARASDYLTGEGIGQAVLTGRVAAEAIVRAGALQPAIARHLYERSVRHHLLADHRLSVLISRGVANPAGPRGAVKGLQRSARARRIFARWMFEDEPRAVLLTPTRWHRHLGRLPGPYR